MARAARRTQPPPKGTPPAPDVLVEEVTTPRGRDAFVRFQLDHYRGDPNFVPPIVAERRDFLDPEQNPFFQQARAALFLARREGTIVGRIAAVVDARSNRFHGTLDGFFGMFECISDAGVASALLETAAGWLKRQGMRRVLGPVNLAFHHDAGMLVEGFDAPPSMMMTYNHRYYAPLVEAAGFVKLKDLWSYELDAARGLPEKVLRLAARAEASGEVTVRPIDVVRPERDVRRIREILETMLKPGLGFAPPTPEEFDVAVHRVKPVILLQPELSLVAEVKGEVVAFLIAIPDTNLALKAAGGSLFPLGLVKMLWAGRRINRLRVLLFGIQDGYRRRGIDAVLAKKTHEAAVRYGYKSGELGWVMDDDTLVTRTIEACGATRIKTYRLFERPL